MGAPDAFPPAARLAGVDFSCAPSTRKPLVVATGQRHGDTVKVDTLLELPTLPAFKQWLLDQANGLLAGFDFPFGLPRVFVEDLARHPPDGFPMGELARLREALAHPEERQEKALADTLIHALHRHCVDRAGFQALVDGWGPRWGSADRPKVLPHRAADLACPGMSSTSPLQTRYVPVGKMYFEGMKHLADADASIPGLREGRPDLLAFEAYPGFLAGELLGRRSYKSEKTASLHEPAAQERLIARLDLIDGLEQGRSRLGLRLKLSPALRDRVAADPKGDRLDAVLCLVQAGWAHRQREAGSSTYGLPPRVDPVEGWILGT